MATWTEYLGNPAYVIEHGGAPFDATRMSGSLTGDAGAATEACIAGPGSLRNRRRHAIDFARCSYLGLDRHPLTIATAIEAIEAQRASGRARIDVDLMGELEETLSTLFCARVLVTSSAMLANMGAMPILAAGQLTGGRKPVVAFDSLAHVSLAYHKPMITDRTQVETIAHNDMDALESLCRKHPLVAYVCDGVCPFAENAPIAALHQLQERYGLFLYIDDAHGISLFGTHGEGFARSQMPQLLGERTIVAASLAKGFGASGGILMLGEARHETLFKMRSIPHVFSSTPGPAAIGAALGSSKIHRSAELGQRQMYLADRLALFDSCIATAQQGNSLPLRMVAIKSEANALSVANGVLFDGFLVTALPAKRQDVSGIRICITAEHEASDIARLCKSILANVAETTRKPYPLR
ncbi:aminotransferase class I/II-fold pyridoxal phosphate-dependent enzyme (plasmid) [Bradyrhizobium sp. 62B]|uniref:aminotransferase class I/II-fold pyridoxal phosphate-dependent enzyme n=1 Tax=Bradyrhizobium sp. 62B TaxID=2898442 RepID=UPI0025582D92|nr:aminotransferase class I/II-fold pyridoxal phosphate-dependent enzyme [Bradyrhizobium sp. 62B]